MEEIEEVSEILAGVKSCAENCSMLRLGKCVLEQKCSKKSPAFFNLLKFCSHAMTLKIKNLRKLLSLERNGRKN